MRLRSFVLVFIFFSCTNANSLFSQTNKVIAYSIKAFSFREQNSIYPYSWQNWAEWAYPENCNGYIDLSIKKINLCDDGNGLLFFNIDRVSEPTISNIDGSKSYVFYCKSASGMSAILRYNINHDIILVEFDNMELMYVIKLVL